MTSATATSKLQRLGLSLRGISIGCIDLLDDMHTQPLPLKPRKHADRSYSTSPGRAQLGPLIKHGLAALDRDAGGYTATEAGRSYLAKVRAAGIRRDAPCTATA
jgi:hypothetical protein